MDGRRVLFTCVLIAACGDSPSAPVDTDFDDDAILNDDDLCPNSAENLNRVFDLDGCPDAPVDLYEVVRDDVEAFWSATLAPIPLIYPPITTFHGYTTPTNSPCGQLGLNNAFYCPVNAGVYYDANLLEFFLDSIGD